MEDIAWLTAHIRGLEEQLLSAEVRASVNRLEELLDGQFFEYGSSGRVWLREDLLGEEGAGAVRMTLSDFALHPLGETAALATYRTYNEDTGRQALRSSVWKLSGGRWRMFFHQGTPENTSPAGS
ncbi:DUF4440 domain-containing protein ['Paenibacillus yunnanensis' Narsing Rao et al. 2020]|uniref:nuclear transport factor 2 family protein n=1 Tax=Paenibacillus tengchongensis TaxID=2608684 RepID=UPI00124E1A82|nr:DUF4440 domain-containing protein [Paenibacillus tengchongensis]